MMKLTVALRNIANPPKNESNFKHLIEQVDLYSGSPGEANSCILRVLLKRNHTKTSQSHYNEERKLLFCKKSIFKIKSTYKSIS